MFDAKKTGISLQFRNHGILLIVKSLSVSNNPFLYFYKVYTVHIFIHHNF